MSAATTSAVEHEAAVMLAFFTEAAEGAAVMDGDGVIWQHSGGFWYAGAVRRSALRKVASIDMARALCPDLAEHMAVTA